MTGSCTTLVTVFGSREERQAFFAAQLNRKHANFIIDEIGNDLLIVVIELDGADQCLLRFSVAFPQLIFVRTEADAGTGMDEFNCAYVSGKVIGRSDVTGSSDRMLEGRAAG